MPKYLNSAAYDLAKLQDKCEALEKENRQLRRELAMLRVSAELSPCPKRRLNAVSPAFTAVPSSSSAPSAPDPSASASSIASPRREKSYMKPTISSQRREVAARRKSDQSLAVRNVSAPFTINGRRWTYNDGRLFAADPVNGGELPRCMRDTEASRNRREATRAHRENRVREQRMVRSAEAEPDENEAHDDTGIRSRTDDKWQAGQLDAADTGLNDPATATGESGGDDGFTTFPLECGWAEEEDSDESLDLDLGRGYVNWIEAEPQLANVFQNDEKALRGLRRAHRLALAALWTACRKGWPPIWQKKWEAGPSFIGSCYGELRHATNGWTAVPSLTRILHGLAELRNYVCHPSPCSDYFALAGYDNYLQHAEYLTAALDDEARPRKLRRIREEWRSEALRTLAEIEERAPLAELPGCDLERLWKPKHKKVFGRVIRAECGSLARANFPRVVVSAAETWAEFSGLS
ncbi:uncharacterized protein THITE_112666 [Thermothielavioides terrestris NRRL 8126]|jgi:hypothetical protein|uniref:Uncharacterized protein n=1 Tax=Thermothielavioides terrestris (strain ATCC 38088 / NRRL 8126) TaxID=578455 RepID=G2QV41_THETT|nr:uncharacterized protein THITE_112666 [Thermothielavioides terrestris NRRL 8126]AEO62928.1 hypothetical protein THITE_112666 [Thermothielavioides terrestris NRRL 8126]